MDHLLGMFGGGPPKERDENIRPQKQDGTWEFEMPLEEALGQKQEQRPVFSIPGGIPIEAVNIQESTIEGYFSTIGWPFERADQGLWMVKYKGGAKDYDFIVELTQAFLVIVVPIIDRVREGCREKLWYHILRLNYQINQVRFGLNKRNEVLLTLEIPTKIISYEEFKNGVQYLCNLVDDAYPEILFLSQKLEAVSSFMREQETLPSHAPEKNNHE